MNNENYPSLETERMFLKILTLENTEEIFHHFSNPSVTNHMDIEPCKDKQEAENIINYHLDNPGCRWGLFNKEGNKVIGTIGFHELRKSKDEFIAEVGFDLSSDYWGKGYMSEALNEVILFGFNQMNLTKIDATVEKDNEQSIKLMNRFNFTNEGETKEHLLYYYLDKEKGME